MKWTRVPVASSITVKHLTEALGNIQHQALVGIEAMAL